MYKHYGSSMQDSIYNAVSIYGKVQVSIASVIMSIMGLILIFIGIKLYYTDESNFIPIKVTISKINSTDNKTCDRSTIIYQETQQDIFSCFIHFKFFDREIVLPIKNSSNNYVKGQTITVIYDKNNMNDDPVIDKILMARYYYWFLIGGFSMSMLGFFNIYMVNSSKDIAAVYGVNSIGNKLIELFNKK